MLFTNNVTSHSATVAVADANVTMNDVVFRNNSGVYSSGFLLRGADVTSRASITDSQFVGNETTPLAESYGVVQAGGKSATIRAQIDLVDTEISRNTTVLTSTLRTASAITVRDYGDVVVDSISRCHRL